MGTAHVNFCEDIFITHVFAIGVDIIHHPIHLKISNHFVHIIRNHEGMGFSGRFKHITSFFSNPIMFQIVPSSFQNKTVNRVWMPMT